MNILPRVANLARSPGDPKIVEAGPSVRPGADDMAWALGWFSIALGVVELLAPQALARFLGMEGKEGLLRAYGVREIAAGMTSLSTEKAAGLWSRVAGDILDIATLLPAYSDDNPKKHNVGLALAAVVAITLVDLGSAKANKVTHARRRSEARDFSDRSGFPKGVDAARGAVSA
jgi:hypothetical protein